MNTKSTSDFYTVFAASILVASSLVWWLAPPDLLKPAWVLGVYKIWVPFIALVIALPIAVIVGRSQTTNGFLSRPLRRAAIALIIIFAMVRIATPSPFVPESLKLDKPEVQALQKKVDGCVPGGVPPPPADIKEPIPTPLPSSIGDLKPGDGGGDQQVKEHAAELHEAQQQNKGNKKAENYIAQAAAAAAALYIMSEIPPPANALVAKVVGQLIVAMFGDGDIDPGEAMFVGQLIAAAVSGDPAQVKAAFEKSDIGMQALEKVTSELTKNQALIKKLQAAGQDPSKITTVISTEMKNRGIDPDAIEQKLRSKFQGQPDAAQILALLTKNLPARDLPSIVANIDDNVKFGQAILKTAADDSMVKDVRERRDLLDVMAKRWSQDAKAMGSNIPDLYRDLTGITLNNTANAK